MATLHAAQTPGSRCCGHLSYQFYIEHILMLVNHGTRTEYLENALWTQMGVFSNCMRQSKQWGSVAVTAGNLQVP